jgi:hypothetical protein
MAIEPVLCAVCESPTGHPLRVLCPRCKKFHGRVETRKRTGEIPLVVPDARLRAMKASWSKKDQCFLCHYSGVRLVETHPHPAYRTFDHTTARDGREVTVVAHVINDMKSVLSDTDFKALVIELAKKFQGGPFDQQLIEDIVYRDA